MLPHKPNRMLGFKSSLLNYEHWLLSWGPRFDSQQLGSSQLSLTPFLEHWRHFSRLCRHWASHAEEAHMHVKCALHKNPFFFLRPLSTSIANNRYYVSFFIWMLGIKLRTSCLCGKQFIKWTISLSQLLIKTTQYIVFCFRKKRCRTPLWSTASSTSCTSPLLTIVNTTFWNWRNTNVSIIVCIWEYVQ